MVRRTQAAQGPGRDSRDARKRSNLPVTSERPAAADLAGVGCSTAVTERGSANDRALAASPTL